MWTNCTKNIKEWSEQINSLNVKEGEKKFIHNVNRIMGYITLFIQI
jgi:hypothetical protein